jgi:adenosylcobinamide-phosphate synthase
MTGIESCLYRDRRGAGVVFALTGTALGVGAGRAVRSTAAATTMAVAGHSLADTATGIGEALDAGDLDRARALLPSLVGRDPTGLDEKEVARAVVESVAENTVDAMVAPALWAALAGAPGVLAHRAVNTLDAMVGHRTDRYTNFGWASARLDDAMAWLPARLTAVLVALVRPGRAGSVAHAVRRQAPAHPSPNAGVAEAAFAAALGLRIGGENRYGDRVELRPPLGDGRAVEPVDIHRAVRLSYDVGSAMAAGLVTVGMLPWRRRRP